MLRGVREEVQQGFNGILLARGIEYNCHLFPILLLMYISFFSPLTPFLSVLQQHGFLLQE